MNTLANVGHRSGVEMVVASSRSDHPHRRLHGRRTARRCTPAWPLSTDSGRVDRDPSGSGPDPGWPRPCHDAPVAGVPHHRQRRQHPVADGGDRVAGDRPADRHHHQGHRSVGRLDVGACLCHRRPRLPQRKRRRGGHRRDARHRRGGGLRQRRRIRLGPLPPSVHHHPGNTEHRSGPRPAVRRRPAGPRRSGNRPDHRRRVHRVVAVLGVPRGWHRRGDGRRDVAPGVRPLDLRHGRQHRSRPTHRHPGAVRAHRRCTSCVGCWPASRRSSRRDG